VRKTQLVFLSILILQPLTVLAVETPQTDAEKIKITNHEPPVVAVVSASKREQPLEKVTRFVTVITREEIERSGSVFVLDLLRAIPGVAVTQSGPLGRTVGIFIRGTNGNHALMMVDGVQINSPTTGQADLADLTTENITSVENIERIEILRGPQSVLYGSKALGGVINIITKAGEKKLKASTRFEYGTHETFYESGVLEGKERGLSFSGSGSRFDTQGPGENDGFQNTRATGHAKLEVTDISNLDVAFHYYNALVGIEDGAFRPDPNAWSKSREQILNTVYTIALTDWWEQKLKYSFFHDMLFSNDPADPGTSQLEFPFKLDTDRHTGELQSNFSLGDFDVLTVGYEFEHARSNNKSFDRIFRTHGWYTQNELTLWKNWTIVGGVRIDYNSFYHTVASPLVSSAYMFEKTQTKFKGSFGRGFRAPSLNELFFPNFGNPNLEPEDNWGWDAGFEQFFWEKKSSLTAAYFHNSIKNLIEFVNVGNFVFQAQNVNRATTQGVELEHKIFPWKNLTVTTVYTYLDATDDATGKRLIRRPWHSGRAGLSYDWWRFHLNMDWAFVGMREDRTGAAARPPREKNPGYTKLDVFLGFDLNKYFQIYGRIEDLTHDHYQEVLGFPNPSTRFVIGTKGKF